jgi:hypothetical protein
MRLLGLSLAGVLALTAPIPAHSASLGSNMGQAMTGPVLGVRQAGEIRGSNWHPRAQWWLARPVFGAEPF